MTEELKEMLDKAHEAMEVNNVQLANDYMDKADKIKAKMEAQARLDEAEAVEEEIVEAKVLDEIIAQANEVAMEAPQHISLEAQAITKPLIEKENNKMNELMTKDEVLMSKEYDQAYWANIMLRATPEQIKMLDTQTTSAGYAVPQITIDRIQEILTKMAGVVAEAEFMDIPGLVSVPYESTMNAASLHTELATISDAADVVGHLPLPTYELTKLLSLSGNLEATSIPSFQRWVESNLFRSILYKADAYAIGGSGSNQPSGIESLTFTDTQNAVAWAGGSLAYADLAEGISLLPAYYDPSAVWIMSKKTYWQNVRGLALGSTYDSVVSDGRLLGYRVVFDDFVTDGVIYFGSIREGLKINVPGGIRVEQGRYLRANAYDFLGSANFGCNVVPNAFIKIAASLS